MKYFTIHPRPLSVQTLIYSHLDTRRDRKGFSSEERPTLKTSAFKFLYIQLVILLYELIDKPFSLFHFPTDTAPHVKEYFTSNNHEPLN